MGKIRVYDRTETEFIRLQTFADIVNDLLEKNGNYDDYVKIETTYFDCGQDWKYSAIIMHEYDNSIFKSMNSYQLFCPRDWELIINTDSISKLKEMAEYYVNLKETKEWNYKRSLYEKFESP